jgi:ATP-dependent helicase/nuclease subunit A
MVLVRRLTQVRHLEEALEAVGLRFTVEGGKSFFDRQEVHEVLAVLRAVDDPSDAVSLVAALRSSFFGVSDRDVAAYALAGGRLSLGPVEEGRPGAPVLGPALALMEELHRERLRLTVPALLDRLYDETRVIAALTGTRRGEAQVANLEKVATLARQSASLGVLTLRGFTRLLEERIANAREEPDLPSTRPGDPRTVRVLSIHKAKGLEAPVVALFDTADDCRAFVDAVPLWDEKRIAVGFRQGCQPPSWSTLVMKERARAEAERRRLLYVACTRARDFLLVPLPPADARVGAFWKDLIVRLPRDGDADVRIVTPSPRSEGPGLRVDLRALASARGGDLVASRWESERQGLLERAAERPFRPVSATRAAARTAPPPAFAPGSRGGKGFGALVHRVLEWMPLDGDGTGRAAAMAEALAPSFGLDDDDARRAADAALRALALPVMQRARDAPRVWRELALWFPEEDELIEGIVDLVFEEDGGLVVVDYKTDHIAPEQALVQAAHHAPQLQLYGRGLAQATGMRVKERLVLFTAIGQAVAV